MVRTYNKRNAEKAYSELKNPEQLSLEEIASAAMSMNQPTMAKLDKIPLPTIRLDQQQVPLLECIFSQVSSAMEILRSNATSSAIKRLKDDPTLAAWVEAGRQLHNHPAGVTCEYCLQEVQPEREAELAAHFNTSDRILKDDIERAIRNCQTAHEQIKGLSHLSQEAFYPELREDYRKLRTEIEKQKNEAFSVLDLVQKSLQEKLTRRTESYSSELPLFQPFVWQEANSAINVLIERHNAETDNHNDREISNFSKIETHFLSAIDQSVRSVSELIDATRKDIQQYTHGNENSDQPGIIQLKTRILENRSKIANSRQTAIYLSNKLAAFLGRDDLKFEPEGDGYRIIRSGRAAKRLSEGEKTAITFLYFVVSLGDQDFDLNEGIVVVDDPISSLDSSSVYQAFAYLKNSVQSAKQVFLLTHNFEFLKLLLNWLQNIPKPKQSGKSTYWMLHCSLTPEGHRKSEIRPLDKVLLQNKNEFAYLLKELMEFESDGTIEKSYPIPNMIRKVLETFLEQHSTGSSLYAKLENLDFEKSKKTALYKFANDLSHPTYSGLDPALVGETQTNIKHLLEMIKEVATVQFNALKQTIA